ncbi:Myb domain [Phytophthora cactorum]|nr:Myb domain [Phytophthora cactorum]
MHSTIFVHEFVNTTGKRERVCRVPNGRLPLVNLGDGVESDVGSQFRKPGIICIYIWVPVGMGRRPIARRLRDCAERLICRRRSDQQLIRIPIRAAEVAQSKRRRRSRRRDPPTERSRLLWKVDEHDRFLEALELYPSGPWKAIADYIGTRTARQTMTHAQKYRQKIERRKLKKTHGEHRLFSRNVFRRRDSTNASTDLLDEATELSVLLEFVNNFQPSEIERATPLLYSQDSVFMVGVRF